MKEQIVYIVYVRFVWFFSVEDNSLNGALIEQLLLVHARLLSSSSKLHHRLLSSLVLS